MAVGTGCGKILLFGEHAAVYGRPAVGIGLPLTIRVRIEESRGKGLEFENLLADEEVELRKFAEFIRDSDLSFGFPDSCCVTIESEVPGSAGLGSSAALCIAVVRALNPNKPVDSTDLWRWANALEAYFHGNASGIDTGLSRGKGVVAFHPSPTDLPRVTRLETFSFALVIGTVKRSGSTKQHVQRLREMMDRGDADTLRAVDELGRLSECAIRTFQSKKTGESGALAIAALADAAHVELQGLGLSVETTDYLLESGHAVGSLGGKLSGAGGGGAFYMIFEDANEASRAGSALSRQIEIQGLPASICGVFSVSQTGVVTLQR